MRLHRINLNKVQTLNGLSHSGSPFYFKIILKNNEQLSQILGFLQNRFRVQAITKFPFCAIIESAICIIALLSYIIISHHKTKCKIKYHIYLNIFMN